MEKMIQGHMQRQRTKMDFKTYFSFRAPNKHLPQDLAQFEEVKQSMVLNGVDENTFNRHMSLNSTKSKHFASNLALSH